MNASKVAIIAIAVVVGAGLGTWLHRAPSDALPSESVPPATLLHANVAEVDQPDSAEPGNELRAPTATDAAPETVDPDDDLTEIRAVELQARLAETLYSRAGRRLVETLATHGIARSDAESTVRGAMDRVAGCVLEAVHAEAELESAPLDTLLLALEAVMADSDIPEAEAMLSTATIQARTEPCILAVAQEAGIPMQ
jgi:hypothetical protein